MESNNGLSERGQAKEKDIEEEKEEQPEEKLGMTTEMLCEEDLAKEEEDQLENKQEMLVVMVEELINKSNWQDEKISFLEKELDMELKLGQER